MNKSETQQALAFAAMCIDAMVKAAGCKWQEMHLRLKNAVLMSGLTTKLDALHAFKMK